MGSGEQGTVDKCVLCLFVMMLSLLCSELMACFPLFAAVGEVKWVHQRKCEPSQAALASVGPRRLHLKQQQRCTMLQ